MSAPGGRLADARDLAVRHILKRPALYQLLMPLVPGLRPRRPYYCARETGLVIEGYPRSGNTFACKAFDYLQREQGGTEIQVASHHHTPAQILRAFRLGVPTLILVRDPEEAVRSALVRAPSLRPERAVRKYLEFHQDILPCRPGFLVADFREVIRDFGQVMERVNRKFGREFPVRAFSEADNAAVLEILKVDAERNPYCTPEGLAAPSERKNAAKASLDLDPVRPLLGEARIWWTRYLSFAEEDAARYGE